MLDRHRKFTDILSLVSEQLASLRDAEQLIEIGFGLKDIDIKVDEVADALYRAQQRIYQIEEQTEELKAESNAVTSGLRGDSDVESYYGSDAEDELLRELSSNFGRDRLKKKKEQPQLADDDDGDVSLSRQQQQEHQQQQQQEQQEQYPSTALINGHYEVPYHYQPHSVTDANDSPSEVVDEYDDNDDDADTVATDRDALDRLVNLTLSHRDELSDDDEMPQQGRLTTAALERDAEGKEQFA